MLLISHKVDQQLEAEESLQLAGFSLRARLEKPNPLANSLNKPRAWGQAFHDSILMDGMELKRHFYTMLASSQCN